MTDEQKPAAQPELKPGWYTYKANQSTRWWDGSKWTSAVQQPSSSPWANIVGGFLLSVMGLAAVFGVPDEPVVVLIGSCVAGIGAAGTLIGVITEGVRQGMRWAAWEDEKRKGL